MSLRQSAFAALMLAMMLGPVSHAFAQAQQPIGQFRDWGAISYNSPSGKVCYALSVPQTELPDNVNHGDNFFVITQRGSQNVSYEPQFIAGYTLQEGSKVNVDVDGTEFTFFVQDNSAWTENAAQDPALVAAMRAGSRMTVRAISRRGTNTTYEYSLSGVTAALEAIQSCN